MCETPHKKSNFWLFSEENVCSMSKVKTYKLYLAYATSFALIYVEPPSKSNDLGVFENLDFFPFFHCIHIEQCIL